MMTELKIKILFALFFLLGIGIIIVILYFTGKIDFPPFSGNYFNIIK